MPDHTPLHKRYRKSLIAVLIFIAYAIGLFMHNLDVRQRLQQNLLDSAQLELAKQADALSYYFAERNNDLAELASSEPIASYFGGRDLGMSVEYGLGMHILSVEDKFSQLIERKRLATLPIYTQFILIDKTGQLIAQTGMSEAEWDESYIDIAPKLGNAPGVALMEDSRQLRFTYPVVIKGQLRGHLVAYVTASPLEGEAYMKAGLRPEAIVFSATGEALTQDAHEAFRQPEIAQILAALGNGRTRSAIKLPQRVGKEKLIAALKENIAGSPLALASLITERELEAHSIPSLLLAAVGAVPFIVMLIVMTEMRQRSRVEEANASARIEAERLAQARSEFLANMSHEICTPLNAILGLAQIGQRGSIGRKAERQFVRIIESGQHLLGVINDILDCAKIEAGKLKVECIPVEPGKVIDSAVTLTAERAFARGLAFTVHEGELPASFRGDPLRLSQILVNLLSNAIKFTDSGSIALEVGIEGEQLCLRVGDTGLGMNAEQIGRLFHPFEQADSSTTRRFGGTGLGLSICSHLVNSMGGSIAVSSHPGAGSSFEVRLPLVAAEPAPPPPPGSIILAGFPADEVRVLLADLSARGIPAHAIDAPGGTVPPDALVAIDARFAEHGAAWRKWLAELRDDGYHVALAGRIDEIDMTGLAESLSGHLSLIERPLRARHFVDCLRNSTRPQPAYTHPDTHLTGLVVLAVDDNEINRLVLADLLAQEGARVDCVSSGAEALAHIKSVGASSYNIVLTDIQMPDMDGYELTHQLHAIAPTLPVLGLTAHAGAEACERCLDAGMLAHIPKPIDIGSLITEIMRHSIPTTAAPCVDPTHSGDAATLTPAEAPPPTAASPAASGLVDWTALETQFNGKTAFVTRLAGKALVSYRSSVIRLRALASGEGYLAELSFLAHSIKGSAGTLKATRIHELAAETDQSARAGGEDSRTLAGKLATELDGLIQELERRTGE